MEYLGSKRRLLENLNSVIDSLPNEIKICCDLFSGTGSVAQLFKEKGFETIANDIQYYSYVQLKALIGIDKLPKFEEFEGLNNYLRYLNQIEGFKGFFYKEYSPSGLNEYNRTFFTCNNAKKIDGIRNEIEKNYQDKKINEEEYFLVLSLLLNSIDRYSNTAVVYEAYLKEFKKSALLPFEVKYHHQLNFTQGKTKIFNEDSKKLINKIQGNLLYLDPPYNTRQYSRNYHILETLMKNDNPNIKGKAGVRVDSFISLLSRKNSALEEMEYIIKNAKFKYILISYNNEGIIKENQFIDMLRKYGNLKIQKIQYSRFKSHNRSNQNKKVTEFLFLLEKE